MSGSRATAHGTSPIALRIQWISLIWLGNFLPASIHGKRGDAASLDSFSNHEVGRLWRTEFAENGRCDDPGLQELPASVARNGCRNIHDRRSGGIVPQQLYKELGPKRRCDAARAPGSASFRPREQMERGSCIHPMRTRSADSFARAQVRFCDIGNTCDPWLTKDCERYGATVKIDSYSGISLAPMSFGVGSARSKRSRAFGSR